jgi:hypothetical protein
VRDRLAPDAYRDLVNSLAVCLGIDALIVLRDICGVSGEPAEALIVRMANTLLSQVLMAGGQGGS